MRVVVHGIAVVRRERGVRALRESRVVLETLGFLCRHHIISKRVFCVLVRSLLRKRTGPGQRRDQDALAKPSALCWLTKLGT